MSKFCPHYWISTAKWQGMAKQRCSWCPQERIIPIKELGDYEAWMEEMREAFYA